MCKRNWKLLAAGVLVAGALGGFALRSAWATPPAGIESALVAGPVVLDAINIGSDGDEAKIRIKIKKGEAECRVVQFRIAPGGHTGWHSHPGPVFVMITKGTMTTYDADGSTAVYPAGTGFAEGAGDVHIGVNAGDIDLELTAFFLIPKGAAPRIDEPAP